MVLVVAVAELAYVIYNGMLGENRLTKFKRVSINYYTEGERFLCHVYISSNSFLKAKEARVAKANRKIWLTI